MATVFNVDGIVNMALRRVGIFAPHDPGSDPQQFQIAMSCLDMIVAEVVETEQPLWLIPDPVTISLPVGQQGIDFVQLAGGNIPTDRFRGPIYCSLVTDSTGYVCPLPPMSQKEYEELSDKEQPGTPSRVFVDRRNLNPLFYFDEVIQVTGYSLRVVFYLLNEVITVGGNHGFPQSWQRYLQYELAADIGSGPCVHLEQGRVDDYRRIAAGMRERLFARQNRQFARPKRVKFRDF
jgi:hypothetical protein